MLDGAGTPAEQLAMRVIVKLAEVEGAERLIEVKSAHIDSCLYHGPVGLDFVERLVAGGGAVRVPTTLNVAALDLIHPDRVRLDPDTRDQARKMMDAYVGLGCAPTFTCAPYQLPDRPAFGEHIAWAESNAIVFANSVLGARTGRYGDFVDICAAITGRVPFSGLHLDEGRRARIVFRVEEDLAADLANAAAKDELFGLVGHIVGRQAGTLVAAVVGLPAADEDALKALGAAAASSGAVALCHVVGLTPEAPTLEAATGGREPERVVTIDRATLRSAWDELSTTNNGPLAAVSVGTPHFSPAEFARLDRLLDGRSVANGAPFFVSTGRDILEEVARQGMLERLERAGLTLVADTCTYITPIIGAPAGSTLMTNSAKWAWYAPGNLDVQVVYGSLADCVESAVKGRIIRERPAYLDG